MIIGARKGNYRKMLECYEDAAGKVFSFDDSKVLPAEQREIFRRIFKGRETRKKVDQDLENRKREKMAQRIIEKLQDKRLKEKGKLNSFVYSSGGNNSNRLNDENAELQAKGAKVNYAVMEINGVVIMEALGQFGNATYIAEKSQELEQNIIKMGRGMAIDQGVIYKVIHETHDEDGYGYDYESGHLFALLEYAITHPKELIQELKRNNKGCTLKTIVQRMIALSEKEGESELDRAIEAVQNATRNKEISRKEILEPESTLEKNGQNSKYDIQNQGNSEGGRND